MGSEYETHLEISTVKVYSHVVAIISADYVNMY